MRIATLPTAKNSEARDRLLRTASAIFYTEGINSVGVDYIVAASKVTRATFYRHFPSKTDLVLAYLQAAHDAIAAQLTGATVEALIEDVRASIQRREFHGCAFICAAAEFEEEDHPVRRAVAAHREWYFGVVRDAFGDEDAARHFVMLRDGAFVGAHLGDAELAAETFRQLTSRSRPAQ
ncbi:TetR/AcrR family transcriptional regulator [Solirubrobacter sp. CPCC 204708]|uniref:TetR/AcrR family transcriptional regulator n=1 Tax=Solirubrobacter deserti TaxID=2282478 RepID=A0ABT4RLL1_9ACTN|nr:TetR/AcrR family transcriptional regulator [Solirubrobacter deserti]MBE2316706.1 TetR/AcrR family transcriptional regulator [Solirubrobacter deserti]MDA0139463.1 TetR/AcrR family transcriptional regulator [Solirubrobacter deserti]